MLAKDLGYQVLWAEESVAVLAALDSGDVEALVGVATLDVLEKALDQILLLDLPCLAIPSWNSDSDDSPSENSAALDADWVREMIELPHSTSNPPTSNYIHLIRAAKRMFEPEDLERLRAATPPTAARSRTQRAWFGDERRPSTGALPPTDFAGGITSRSDRRD